MPDYVRACSIEQLFNFSKRRLQPVGAINALTIGMTTLVADMTVTDPSGTTGLVGGPVVVQSAGALAIVGALKKVSWRSVRDNEPITIEGAISGKNRKVLLSILYSSQVDMNVRVSFMLYDYDMEGGLYFVGLSSNAHVTGTTPIAGVLKKRADADLELSVESDPVPEPQSPVLYPFSMTIEPPTSGPQYLYLAMSSSDKLIRTWGRAARAASSAT